MALEQAGVSLEAEGFAEYLKKLDKIEKKQQEVFDTKFKDTQKSFVQVTKAAKVYEKELNDLAKAERRATDEAKKLAVAQKTSAAAQRQAAISTANAALQVAGSFAQFAVENAKLAAQFKGQQAGLNNLAASFGQSGNKIQSAIQEAARGTVSGFQAIQAANQALLLGVARTPEEFKKVTKSAVVLGGTFGMTAADSIERFTLALGRQSVERLDDFGIKANDVRIEMERLAQVQFGKTVSKLDEGQKSATFMAAALNIADRNVERLGDNVENASSSFERLDASTENLKVTFGELGRPLATTISDALSRAAKTAQQFFAFLGAGFAGFGVTAAGVIDNIGRLFRGEATRSFDEILQEGSQAAAARFKEIASTIEGTDFGEEKIKAATRALEDQANAAKTDEAAIKALGQAIQQAEQLQLSFARAAEDAARQLARQQEDVARNTARAVAKLEKQQAKDRADLLDDQVKELEKFDKERAKQIANAEKDIAKERQKAQNDIKRAQEDAARDRIRAQEKLQRELKQAQDRFNLSQLQSERRFQLSEKRLRAEGDILGLQQLREDQELARQEEKENFALQQKETKDNAKEQTKDQGQELEDRIKKINRDAKERINDLKANLEQQRAELLANFDQELLDQQAAQEEARIEQQRGFDEQAEDRAIALQRAEEDRRISEQRQLEDLGRSLADQKDVTEEGARAIAEEIEKVFGIEGVADAIFDGFADRTESKFAELFGNVAEIVNDADLGPVPGAGLNAPVTTPGGRVLPGFQDGGIIPGPVGSPQLVKAHGGETVLPTHKQSFIMPAPVVPSQTLSVEMSGGFNITGGEGASADIIEASVEEMTETVRVAIRRIARRTNI